MKPRVPLAESTGRRNDSRPVCTVIAVILAVFQYFCLALIGSSSLAADDHAPKDVRPVYPEVGTSEAVAEVGIGDLYALVVGVSRYKDPRIPQLTVSDKDARDFAAFLRTQRTLFKNVHVDLLENEKATKQEVEKHLYYKLRRAGKDDTVVLFLSGHGADDPNTPGEFVFLTHDADPDFLTVTSVQMSRQWFLQKLDSKRVLLIADACHAGGFSRQEVKSLQPSFQKVLEQFKESEGRVFLTSSRPDESSREKPEIGNSIFTYYLLKGLKGEASDKDGVVTLKGLYDYVYSKTKDETGGFQRPQMDGRQVGRFPLSVVSKITPDMVASTTSQPEIVTKPRRSVAGLVLKTEPPRVKVRIGSREARESGNDGLLIVSEMEVGVPHSIRLQKAGFTDQVLSVTIPESYEGKVYRHGDIRLSKIQRDDRSVQESLPSEKHTESTDYSRIVSDLVRSIEKGKDQARKDMNRLYHKSEAMARIKTAADQGDVDAQFALGRAYHLGVGVSKDYATARHWYMKAAAQASAGAECNLGYMYHYGQGVPKDGATATEWFRKAASHGDTDAQRMIGTANNN